MAFDMETDMPDRRLARATVRLVSVYLGNNTVPEADLPQLIREVHQTLRALQAGAEETEAEPLVPAVPVKKSVTREHIICLEDGLKFKSLKRHLRSKYDLSPQEYRERWGLPEDYPMVAPGYSEKRSKLAKKIGLGRN
jgi:predicted transcriptional regulator